LWQRWYSEAFKNSEELIDFLIYLSPTDVWTGKIYYNTVSKKIKIFSDDDSILVAITPEFASPANPVDQDLFPVECTDDGTYLGYVEVIECGFGQITNTGATTVIPPIAKARIWSAYDTGSIFTAPGGYGGLNVLAGFMELTNPVAGMSTSYQATTFRDYKNNAKLGTALETKIGANTTNSLMEIEASFSKDNIAMPYVRGNDVALQFFTFPTKLTNFASCTAVTTVSPFFTQHADSTYTNKTCILFTNTNYDLKENSIVSGSPYSGGTTLKKRFCDEVNVLSSSDISYTEGWSSFVFGFTTPTIGTNYTAAQALSYYGAPVLATYLYIGDSGLSGNYAAWSNGAVSGDTAEGVLTDYQYTDADATATVHP